MNIWFCIALNILLQATALCMEQSVDLGLFPLEIIGKIKECGMNQVIIKYRTVFVGGNESLALPWTIHPQLLKFCTTDDCINRDLTNPCDGDQVLPNAQLWYNGSQFRLSEDTLRTNDIFHRKLGAKFNRFLFDGINTKHKALDGCKYNVKSFYPSYDLYMMTQSTEKGSNKKFKNHKPIISGNGLLSSLMLYNNSNRFVYSVKEINNTLIFYATNKYMLYIKELIDNPGDHLTGACRDIASQQTDVLFEKTVPLDEGNDIYFGITDQGALYKIARNGNSIECVQQKCSKKFVDISVDTSVTTATGFCPKMALLGDNGDLFIVHLDAFVVPTLMFAFQVPNHKKVKRLFYKNNKIIIMYYTKSLLEDVFVWEDNWETIYTNILLRSKTIKEMPPEITEEMPPEITEEMPPEISLGGNIKKLFKHFCSNRIVVSVSCLILLCLVFEIFVQELVQKTSGFA